MLDLVGILTVPVEPIAILLIPRQSLRHRVCHVDHGVVRKRGLGCGIFGPIEGGFRLLVGDDLHVIGGEPAALIIEEPIPPA